MGNKSWWLDQAGALRWLEEVTVWKYFEREADKLGQRGGKGKESSVTAETVTFTVVTALYK